MTKLLLIDDDHELCLELGQILKNEGFKVNTAFDGAQGLELFANQEYDVIILDIKLPGLSGFEVLKKIRQRAPFAKVLVLSGRPIREPLLDQRGVENDPEEVTLHLADTIMNKPFMIPDFIEKIRDLASKKGEKSQ